MPDAEPLLNALPAVDYTDISSLNGEGVATE